MGGGGGVAMNSKKLATINMFYMYVCTSACFVGVARMEFNTQMTHSICTADDAFELTAQGCIVNDELV